MSTSTVKRFINGKISSDIETDELLAMFFVEFTPNSTEAFGEACSALLHAIPDNRLYEKPRIHYADTTGAIYIRGVLKTVFSKDEFEESDAKSS